MDGLWEPIDSGCYANDTAASSEDILLVTPEKKQRFEASASRPPRPFLRKSKEQHSHLARKELKSFHNGNIVLDGPLVPMLSSGGRRSSHSVSASADMFHLRMRRSPATNPFTSDILGKEFHSPPISLSDLTESDSFQPLSPCWTPKVCRQSAHSSLPPSFRPSRVHYLSITGADVPDNVLIPEL
mmetsp:Transcript_31459/g.56986  ORF Transcript_31459/g.56986 Transcript_31459/m.56986 type:complete len:185 (+) Transcript_31459:460-1014(+)